MVGVSVDNCIAQLNALEIKGEELQESDFSEDVDYEETLFEALKITNLLVFRDTPHVLQRALLDACNKNKGARKGIANI